MLPLLVGISSPAVRRSNTALAASPQSVQSTKMALNGDKFIRFGTGRPQQVASAENTEEQEAQAILAQAQEAYAEYHTWPQNDDEFKTKRNELARDYKQNQGISRRLTAQEKRNISITLTKQIVNKWINTEELFDEAAARLGVDVSSIRPAGLTSPNIPNMSHTLMHRVRNDPHYKSQRAFPPEADFELPGGNAATSLQTPPDNAGFAIHHFLPLPPPEESPQGSPE